MITLYRSPGECIRLILEDGREILIELANIKSGRSCAISIDAPKSILVLREELVKK